MARNDGVDRTIVRNQPRTESTIAVKGALDDY